MWYRRNAADLNIRELERRWAQGDNEAGLQLQAWKRRTEPLPSMEEIALSIVPIEECYIYSDELYCDDCGDRIKAELLAGEFQEIDDQGYAHQLPEVYCNNQLCDYRAPITQAQRDEDGSFICGDTPEGCDWPDVRVDEYSYTSDIFPVGPRDVGENDSPRHCASQERCVNAIQLDWDIGGVPDSVGGLFGGGLTEEGIYYVIEAIQEARHVSHRNLPDLWGEFYSSDYPLIAEAWEAEQAYRRGDVENADELRGNPFDVPELEALRSKFCAAAQQVYDSWHQNEQGWSEDVADGGVCHYIAEAICEVLGEHGIDSTSFSFSIGEVHVTAVADINGAAYMVDIPARVYETGGGYTWRKIPGVVFEPNDIHIESMGEDFEDYLQEY